MKWKWKKIWKIAKRKGKIGKRNMEKRSKEKRNRKKKTKNRTTESRREKVKNDKRLCKIQNERHEKEMEMGNRPMGEENLYRK